MPRLDIESPDASTELFVVGGGYQLVARGTGALQASLAPGVYKVRAVSGRADWEELLVLDADRVLRVPAVEFGSAVPLSHTSRSHEYHMLAAREATANLPPPGVPPPTPRRGLAMAAARRPRTGSQAHGAALTFMARWWTPPSATPPAAPLADPAGGARLLDAGGRLLMPLDAGGMEIAAGLDTLSDPLRIEPPSQARAVSERMVWQDVIGDRYTATSMRADPGIYTLQLRDRGFRTERSIPLLGGWRTQVFALYEPREVGVDDGPPRLVDLAIHVAREGFREDDPGARDTEAARFALADERSVAGPELIEAARSRAPLPMLLLFSAHLLLVLRAKEVVDRRRGTDRPDRRMRYDHDAFLDLVARVAAVFGDEHPDVRALRDRATDPLGDAPLRALPMIARGWQRLLRRSVDEPALVPVAL